MSGDLEKRSSSPLNGMSGQRNIAHIRRRGAPNLENRVFVTRTGFDMADEDCAFKIAFWRNEPNPLGEDLSRAGVSQPRARAPSALGATISVTGSVYAGFAR